MRSFILKWVVSLVVLCTALTAQSARDDLSRYRDRFLLGFELELEGQKIANLVPHFDVDHLEAQVRAHGRANPSALKKMVSDAVLQDYLSHPAAFSKLSPTLQTQLTEGLVLSENILVTPEGSSGGKIITGTAPDTKPLRPTALEPIGLSLPPEAGKVRVAENPAAAKLPPEMTERPLHSSHGVIRSTAADWQVLYSRWNALPWETKIEQVRFSLLSPTKIARIIPELPVPKKNRAALGIYLRLKPSAPPVLQKMEYSLDGLTDHPGVLEINPKEPTKDPVRFLRDIDELAKLSGAETQIMLPHLQKRADIAFHMHMTALGFQGTREEFGSILREGKKLVLLRLLAAGEQNDSALIGGPGGVNRYSQDASHHDIVRWVTDPKYPFREELRDHFANPEAELREFMELMDLPPQEARAAIAGKIQALLKARPDLIERIARLREEVLWDFMDYLPDRNFRIREALIQELRSGEPPRTVKLQWLLGIGQPEPLKLSSLRIALEAVEAEPYHGLLRISSYLPSKAPFSPEVEREVANLIQRRPEILDHMGDGLIRLVAPTHWPRFETALIDHLLKEPNENRIYSWKRLMKMLDDSGMPHALQSEILRKLTDRIAALKKNGGLTIETERRLKLFLESSFPGPKKHSSAVLEEVRRKILTSGRPSVEAARLMATEYLEEFKGEAWIPSSLERTIPAEQIAKQAEILRNAGGKDLDAMITKALFSYTETPDLFLLRRLLEFSNLDSPQFVDSIARLLDQPKRLPRQRVAKSITELITLRSPEAIERLSTLVTSPEGKRFVVHSAIGYLEKKRMILWNRSPEEFERLSRAVTHATRGVEEPDLIKASQTVERMISKYRVTLPLAETRSCILPEVAELVLQ